MENIQFDTGVRSYCINGGKVLRFNPCDPNLYSRFLESVEKLKAVEQALTDTPITQGQEAVQGMALADEKMKSILNWVFGGGNDFREILEGVNLLAVADNGERVVTNLFRALEPVLIDGARRCAAELAANAGQAAH